MSEDKGSMGEFKNGPPKDDVVISKSDKYSVGPSEGEKIMQGALNETLRDDPGIV